MNRKFYLSGIPVMFFVAVAAVSCVNKDYKVDELNKEVHLAPNGVGLPLATIEKETLGDLFKNQTDLVVGDDGYYKFQYTGDPFGFTVPGISVGGLGGISTAFPSMQLDLGIPSFDFSGETKIEGLNLTRMGTLLGLSGSVAADLMFANNTITSIDPVSGVTTGEIEIDFGLPAEVGKVNKVWLGPDAAGTPVTVTFDLGELQKVNDYAFIMSMEVELPARYILKNPSKGTIYPDNKLTVTNFSVGADQTAAISFYIESLTLGDKTPAPAANPGPGDPVNEIKFTEPFTYTLVYDFYTKAGTVDASGTPPSVKISGAPAFKDAEITTNPIVLNKSVSRQLSYSLNSIAAEVVKVAGVDFAAGHQDVTVKVGNPGLPGVLQPNINVTFPSGLSFTDPRGKISNGVLTAPLSDFFDPGYTLQLNSIGLDKDPSGGAVNFSGDIKVEVDETISSKTLTWSTDIAPLNTDSNVGVSVNASGLDVSTVRVKLDLPLDSYIAGKLDPIDLSKITEKMGDGEQHPDLKAPNVYMSVTNPAGISVTGDLKLAPRDKSGNLLYQNPVMIDGIAIDPADSGGAKTTNIFIGEQGDTAPAGYTAYYKDLGNLMKTLPTTIDLSLSARATPDVVHAIQVNQDFDFEMSYDIDMPIVFGDEMDIAVEITENGLNGTFSDLAKYKVKAADISVSAELTVTFPLRMSGVTAEFLDADGNSINGLATTVAGVVEGPAPGAGGTKTSTLTIAISVPGGGDFTTLSQIDQLKLRLPLSGTGAANRLKPDDYISGKVWLTLANGLQVDLDKL